MATKILCRASDCIFNEARWCSAEEITYDPVDGCLTYEVVNQADLAEAEEVLLEEELTWEEELLFENESGRRIWKDETPLEEELKEELAEHLVDW